MASVQEGRDIKAFPNSKIFLLPPPPPAVPAVGAEGRLYSVALARKPFPPPRATSRQRRSITADGTEQFFTILTTLSRPFKTLAHSHACSRDHFSTALRAPSSRDVTAPPSPPDSRMNKKCYGWGTRCTDCHATCFVKYTRNPCSVLGKKKIIPNADFACESGKTNEKILGYSCSF